LWTSRFGKSQSSIILLRSSSMNFGNVAADVDNVA
jgi:hypothetical protein